MNRVICQLAYRESVFYVVPILLLMLGDLMFQIAPFRYFDTILGILSVAFGFFLAKRIFSDNGGVRPFLFSRAFSPSRFFLVRWCFGLAVIFSVVLIMGLIMACGLRDAFQRLLFHNGWFPMVRYQELNVLWTVLIATLMTYHTTLFFVIRNRYLGKQKFRPLMLWSRRLLTFIVMVYFLVGIFFLVMFAGIDLFISPGYPFWGFPFALFVFGVPALFQVILIPWCGLYCYNNQEIES